MAHLVGGFAGAAFGVIIAGTKGSATPKGGTTEELQKLLGGGAAPKPKKT
jgi:hypothetical protein